MIAIPRYCWFRFSLRTMFVVVTIVACWLGWQLKIVRDRKEMRTWIVAHGGTIGRFDDPFTDVEFEATEVAAPPVSWLRQSLGDDAVDYILLRSEKLEPVRQHLTQLFPESKINPRILARSFEMLEPNDIRGRFDKTLLNDMQ